MTPDSGRVPAAQISEQQLAEWERLVTAATEGPWTARRQSIMLPDDLEFSYLVCGGNAWQCDDYTTLTEADCAFIAAAREAVPALLAALRASAPALVAGDAARLIELVRAQHHTSDTASGGFVCFGCTRTGWSVPFPCIYARLATALEAAQRDLRVANAEVAFLHQHALRVPAAQ